MLVQKAREYKSSSKKGKKRTVKPPELDKSCPWDFFDGASQGDPPIGGAGGIIYLDETNKSPLSWDWEDQQTTKLNSQHYGPR